MKDRPLFYFHDVVNVLVTAAIFGLLILIALKVFKNIGSLLNIITL
ncbi:MAG: hypothetical protein V1794_05135 [Candidatus Glassbacteria bacterium]